MCGEARRRPVSSRGGKPEGSLLAGPAEQRREGRGGAAEAAVSMLFGA